MDHLVGRLAWTTMLLALMAVAGAAMALWTDWTSTGLAWRVLTLVSGLVFAGSAAACIAAQLARTEEGPVFRLALGATLFAAGLALAGLRTMV